MDLRAEWLEADAQGGFASGTVGGERTRRYHALLLVATHPPGGRSAERDRGLDCVEDLSSPGRFVFDLEQGCAVLVFSSSVLADADAERHAEKLAEIERRRRDGAANPLVAAAACYIVDGSRGKTVVAGSPWFTDWGRDTFIAMRGLVLSTGRLAEADAILSTWASLVDQGMLPNRFSEDRGAAEYNTVDAPLWFVVAVEEFLRTPSEAGYGPHDEARAAGAVQAILDGFASGARHRIALDTDGLVCAGEPGLQLTWMDAKIGSLPVQAWSQGELIRI